MQNWLEENERNCSDLKFKVIDISEKNEISDSLERQIAFELLQAFYPLDGLKRRIKNKSQDDIEKFVKNLFSPNRRGYDSSVRTGDWGEVFSGLYLQQIKEHVIPLYKIRYKHRNNKSIQMLDLLTFKENDNSIHFNEIKTRSSALKDMQKNGITIANSKYDVAKNAYEELISEYNADTPLIYSFISRMFDNNQNYDLADQFDEYIKTNNNNKKGNIFLLFEKKYWDNEIINKLNNVEIEIKDLKVIVVLINDLKSLIETTYQLTIDIARELKNE
jgi:hypothetical protein